MECPFKKQIIKMEYELFSGENIIKEEVQFLSCSEKECAAYDLAKMKCKLVERVNSI